MVLGVGLNKCTLILLSSASEGPENMAYNGYLPLYSEVLSQYIIHSTTPSMGQLKQVYNSLNFCQLV